MGRSTHPPLEHAWRGDHASEVRFNGSLVRPPDLPIPTVVRGLPEFGPLRMYPEEPEGPEPVLIPQPPERLTDLRDAWNTYALSRF